MKYLTDINFLASVVTILSIFLALYIFWHENHEKRKERQQSYLNQLESLKFELKKNYEVILGFFDKDRSAWMEGTKIAHFRFSTGVTNRLIAVGALQNQTLLRNLDAIADNQNQVNRILDIITLMAETSQIGSQGEKEMFARRIKDSSVITLNLNAQIQKYLPMVITDLEKHILDIKNG